MSQDSTRSIKGVKVPVIYNDIQQKKSQLQTFCRLFQTFSEIQQKPNGRRPTSALEEDHDVSSSAVDLFEVQRDDVTVELKGLGDGCVHLTPAQIWGVLRDSGADRHDSHHHLFSLVRSEAVGDLKTYLYVTRLFCHLGLPWKCPYRLMSDTPHLGAFITSRVSLFKTPVTWRSGSGITTQQQT